MSFGIFPIPSSPPLVRMNKIGLQQNLNELSAELEKYSFDIKHLGTQDKNKIKELYTILYKIHDNKIFIENLKNCNVRVTDKILINGIILPNCLIDLKTTLYFYNCNHTNVVITNKVCHITIDQCSHLNIQTRGGSITGLDDINCKHIVHVFNNSSLYFLDVSNSEGCVFYIAENTALDTMISSCNSPDIKILLTCPINGIIKNKFNPLISFFDNYRLYTFEQEDDVIQMTYNTKYNKQIVKAQ